MIQVLRPGGTVETILSVQGLRKGDVFRTNRNGTFRRYSIWFQALRNPVMRYSAHTYGNKNRGKKDWGIDGTPYRYQVYIQDKKYFIQRTKQWQSLD